MTSHRSINRNTSALTRKEVLAIIACVFALGIFVVVPVVSKVRDKALRMTCQSQLKWFGVASREWRADFGDRYPMSISTNQGGSLEWGTGPNLYHHFLAFSNVNDSPQILTCPSDDRKPAASRANLRNTNLSYFLALDASETMPAMLVAGDRNLVTNGVPVASGLVVITNHGSVGWSSKMHKFSGNAALVDGSVQQTSPASLQMLFQNTGTNLNRLAIP